MSVVYLLLAIGIFVVAALVMGGQGTGSDGKRARPWRSGGGQMRWKRRPPKD